MKTTDKTRMRIMRQTWGRQDGWVFLPWITGTAESRDERRRAFHEGPAFHWPRDEPAILEHMAAHRADDLYWCPVPFEGEHRVSELAMDEYALWADLDEVDPATLDDEYGYQPTVAWETSPGRYQCLWIVSQDVMGASWPGNENQRMTYLVGADAGGWDTTQLLRVPGWANHKPEYRDEDGAVPVGRLLWLDGRVYLRGDFDDLPEVPGAGDMTEALDVVAGAVEGVDRHEVLARVRLKIKPAVRRLIQTTLGEVTGDRSGVIWRMENELAEAGCSAAEIVAVVAETAWVESKYHGRRDKLRRLASEAAKAVAVRHTPSSGQSVDASDDAAVPEHRSAARLLFDLCREAQPPRWLVEDVWTREAVGLIAGEPKSYKSWIGLDLALSVATGAPFLDHFRVSGPGPVLYVQEEDSVHTVKARVSAVWPNKRDTPQMSVDETGTPEWGPGAESGDPAVFAVVREGFILSDGAWLEWLDEQLRAIEDVALLVIDPLLSVMGEVEENKASEVQRKLLRPLGQLRDAHGCAVAVIHHMRKSREGDTRSRGGSRLLGSVAYHAWTEAAMYVTPLGTGGIRVERESKHADALSFHVAVGAPTSARGPRRWRPRVSNEVRGVEQELAEEAREAPRERQDSHHDAPHTNGSPRTEGGSRRLSARERRLLDACTLAPQATAVIAKTAGGLNPLSARNGLYSLAKKGLVIRLDGERYSRWILA